MIGAYIILGGMGLTAIVLVVLDEMSRRRKHRGAK